MIAVLTVNKKIKGPSENSFVASPLSIFALISCLGIGNDSLTEQCLQYLHLVI